jgi:hypothetical protein
MNDLILCASCTRHVRRAEEWCPFCGTALPDAAKTTMPRTAPPGLSRAKLYAFHAAIATGVATAACGGSTVVNGDAAAPSDARAGDGQNVGDASGDVATADAGGQDGRVDGAADAASDGTTTPEAGKDAIADVGIDWVPPPPYGCVFPEGCGDVKV